MKKGVTKNLDLGLLKIVHENDKSRTKIEKITWSSKGGGLSLKSFTVIKNLRAVFKIATFTFWLRSKKIITPPFLRSHFLKINILAVLFYDLSTFSWSGALFSGFGAPTFKIFRNIFSFLSAFPRSRQSTRPRQLSLLLITLYETL